MGFEAQYFLETINWRSNLSIEIETEYPENWKAHLTLLMSHASMWHVDIIRVTFGLHPGGFESGISSAMVTYQKVEMGLSKECHRWERCPPGGIQCLSMPNLGLERSENVNIDVCE